MVPVAAPEAIREFIPTVQSLMDKPLDLPVAISARITKAEELNALAYLILEQQRENKLTVTKEVRDAIRSRLDVLSKMSIDKNLEQLRSRLEFVQQLISQPDQPAAQSTNAPTAKPNFLTSFFGNIGGSISSTIGGLVGNLGVPDFIKRGVFSAMTMPQFLPGGQLMGKALIETGERNLALMDVKDFLIQSPDFTPPNAFSDLEWKQFKASGRSVEELVADYVSTVRANDSLAQPDDRTITLAKIMNAKTKATDFQNLATSNLMLAIQNNDVWKAKDEQPGISKVEFSTTETSVTTGGVLTAARSDFDSSGAPLEGSNAFKLATMKTELPKASRLILGQEPTKATIEWIGSQKVATIPADFGLALSLFNEILANNKPESVSKIEVADIDSLKSDTAVLSYKDGERGVVRVRKNPAMLTMLAGKIGGMSADDNEQRKWKLTDDKLEQAPVNPVKLS